MFLFIFIFISNLYYCLGTIEFENSKCLLSQLNIGLNQTKPNTIVFK